MNKNTNNYNKLYLGFLAGGAIGALAALVFTPKSGRELVADMKEKGCDLYKDVKEMASDLEVKVRGIVDDVREKADHLRKEADHRLSEAHLKACRALDCREETGAEA